MVGSLGGPFGLGGTEFRLPLVIGWFRFAALEAVILNRAVRLVVVAPALPFRSEAEYCELEATSSSSSSSFVSGVWSG